MFHSKQDVDRHVNEVFKNIKSEYQRNSKCYQIAKLYYKFKDYKSAIKYINRYILTTTNSAAAYKLLGECYLGVGLKEKAIESFKTSLEFNGSQNDLILKICTLLMDPDVVTVTPRATYWLERAETLFPTNPIVFQLRGHILKANLDGKQDNGQLEKLMISEISARPTDVTVRIRLLNFFVETKRYKIAYQYALEIEDRKTFSNDLRWYDCLCHVVQAYEKANSGLEFSFFIKKIIFFEKRADLSMQEFQEEVKTLPECSAALFAFDQNLHSLSKINVPQEETYFFSEFMKHMKAQLSFHLATLALKRAKKEYGIWPKAFRTASPLLLLATQNTMDLDEAVYNMWNEKTKLEKEVQQLNKSAAFRISQAGHVLLAWSQSKGPKFLEMVSQFCGGKWQNHVYNDIFYSKEHRLGIPTSHFINEAFFADVPMRLLTEAELSRFDEVSQSAYPDSLHHLVWLGLAYCNANGYLSNDFRCTVVPDLQFTVPNLSQTGPETLNQLDVDAFLYASVLCAKSAIPHIASSDRLSRLPVSISEELCSQAQADWWVAVYKTYTNQTVENIADTRLKLRKGIEVIRVFGQHGLHVRIIVMLAKLFQDRAMKNKNPDELIGLENRAHLYWTAAIPLLEKLGKNQLLRDVPNRLFDYRGKDLTPNEIKGFLEDGKLFLACCLMKLGKHEQAIEAFQSLRSPYASFYQALIYEKLADDEENYRPESITSENKSQRIILLTRAQDALYLTIDRLRCPTVDHNHPLNAQLQDHLEKIEKKLAMIDPESNLNHNENNEADTIPEPGSPEAKENLECTFNVYNTSNFLPVKNNSTSRNLLQKLSDRHHTTRFEARPSPERLDAQLRHLVQANSNGLQAIVEQLKEMKSTMQIELKDLGCVTRDLLAEMKRWNDRLESMSKRATDILKPEDLFEMRDEDYEDISQLSQPYTSYQNYPVNRQMTGMQGTSTVTYGPPVPSPVPPVAPVIPTPDNSLIPPTFYSGTHSVTPIDPSLLLYPSLGYYAPGMPYGENPNVPEYRGTGIQKGMPFAKTSLKAPDAVPISTALSTKPQPPNVVITSSDTLPAFTSAGTPTMSVTVPPQHIRGLAPSIAQKPTQVHPFQIQMPPQAQLVKESPTEKLNSLIPTTSLSTNCTQPTLVSGIKPTPVEQITPFKETGQTNLVSQVIKKTPEGKIDLEQKLEEKKLFESRGALSVFDKQWSEKGIVLIKILHDDKLEKAKLILQEPSSAIYIDHYITSHMTIEPLEGKEFGWVCTLNAMLQSGLKSKEMGVKGIPQKICIQFNTLDESRDFEFAFKEGVRMSEGKTQVAEQKLTTSKEIKLKECTTCKVRIEGTSEKCSACESEVKLNEKTNFGGFTFNSPILKPPTLKLFEEKEKPNKQAKFGPLANFSFSPSTSTPSSAESQAKTTTPITSGSQTTSNVVNSSGLFQGLKVDPNAFTKSANFKGFGGEDSLVFGYLNKPKAESQVKTAASETTKNEDDNEGEEDFVPTAEFEPVVELPDLVDVKTGEENDKVLYDEKAKLLRFDKSSKEWKERGVGQMRVLLNEESGKVRLIMRRELVLKVCCNHYLDEKMEFKRLLKSDRALTWYAQDYSEGEIKAELFALKFGNQASMVRFQVAINNAQEKMKSDNVKNSKTKNITEEKPKDITEEKPKELKPISELFKPKAGSWECGTCMLRNDETSVQCVSCETPKPGTQGKSSPVSQNTELGKGITLSPANKQFTFGIPQSTGTSFGSTSTTFGSKSTTEYTFGVAQTTTSSTPFTFGVNLSTSANSGSTIFSPNTKFTFGIPQTSTTTSDFSKNKNIFSTTNPSVTSNSATTTTPSFTFGIPSISSVGTTPVSTSASIPTFGTTQAKTTVSTSLSSPLFTFSMSNSSTKKNESSDIFGSEHFKPKKEENKSVTPLSSSQTGFPFSASTLKPEGKKTFEFSLSNIKPVDAKALSPKTKSSSPKRKAGDDEGASEDSEEGSENEEDSGDHIVVKPIVSLPDNVTLQTGEEDEEVLYQKRAKLFRFVDKEWKERGIGNIKILKHKINNKKRLLMRRDTILKVCLNQYLTPDFELKFRDEKTWTWGAADFSEGEVRVDTFALRFKTPAFAMEFKEALDDALKESSPSKSDLTVKEPSAAMKNFTFAVPKSEPPKSSQTGTSDDDILVVYENNVTPEQREKAKSLQLPPKFYSYLQAPKCPGCPGCEKDDEPTKTQANPPFETSNKPNIKTMSWGSLNFGKDDNSENKVLFTFAGNQGPIKCSPLAKVDQTTRSETQDLANEDEDKADYEEEEEEENDEDNTGDENENETNRQKN